MYALFVHYTYTKMFQQIKLTDSYTSFRKLPLNYKIEDEGIFKHETTSKIAPCYLIEIKNLFYKGYGLVQISATRKLAEPFLLYNIIQQIPSFYYWVYILKQMVQGRVKTIHEPVVFVVDQWSEGYFHWFAEVLPRLIAAKEKVKSFTVILPAKFKKYSFIASSLDQIGFKFQFLDSGFLYQLKDVYFISHFAISGNYNDNLMIKTRELLKVELEKLRNNRFVYISRRYAGKRSIQNESEIVPFLKSLNFEIVIAEELSFKEQKDLFSSVTLLVSNHGAGLTNMLFMNKGSSVIELRKINDKHNNCYFSLASALDIDYYYLKCDFDNPGDDPHNTNLFVNIGELKKLLTSLTAAEHHEF